MINFIKSLNNFYNKDEYLNYIYNISKERISFAEFLGSKNSNKKFQIDGYCKFCDESVSFNVDWLYSNLLVPNYRERMICSICGLNNRQRFIASLLKIELEGTANKKVYIYEQVTKFYKNIYLNFSKKHEIIGSEYLGFEKNKGELVNGIRHEDALDLSFEDSSLDIIISQDVLEHVPNYVQAIRESYRVLKEKGILLISVPFDFNKDITEQRAKIDNNELVHLLPEVYHGNPIDENGSLVFFDYGWDLLEQFKHNGFKNIFLVSYWNYFYGHIGGSDQFIFIAIK